MNEATIAELLGALRKFGAEATGVEVKAAEGGLPQGLSRDFVGPLEHPGRRRPHARRLRGLLIRSHAGESTGSGVRFLDNVSVNGPIPLMASEALNAVRWNMSRRALMTGGGRRDVWDHLEEALRESSLVDQCFADAYESVR